MSISQESFSEDQIRENFSPVFNSYLEAELKKLPHKDIHALNVLQAVLKKVSQDFPEREDIPKTFSFSKLWLKN